MNKFQFVAIACLLALAVSMSCCNECKQFEDNKQIVIAANDAINAKDIDKIRELYAANFVRHCQATPDAETSDFEYFLAMFEGWTKSTPDAHQTINMIIAEGDLVAWNITYGGTHLGEMNGIPPTGKKISLDCYGFHRIENGKIAETWVTWDNMAMMAQLGLLPSPEPKITE